MTDTDAKAPDGQARPADTIPVEAKEAQTIQTAATRNAAAEAEAAKAAEPVVADPAAAETTAQAEPEPRIKKPEPWVEKRIADEAFQRREAVRQARALEEENRALAAKLAALQGGQTPAPVAQAPAANQPLQVNPADYDRAVSAEAERRLAQAKFDEDCNRVAAAGKEAYPDFDAALNNLQLAGVMSPENVQALIATGDGHRLIYELGNDPAEAARIFSMPPRLAAIEIGKRSATKTPAKAAPVSKAPAPIKPLDGSVRVSSDPRDDDDDETYFQKRLAQRRAHRG